MDNNLKLLEQSKKRLNSELEILAELKLQAAQNHNEVKNRLKVITDKIKELSPVALTISDHALVRYMERVSGINLDELRVDVISNIQPLFNVVGDGLHPLNMNFKAVVKDGKVITIHGVE